MVKVKKVGEVLIKDDIISMKDFTFKDEEGGYCCKYATIEVLKWAQTRINDELEELYKEDKENIKNSIVAQKMGG